MADNSPFQFQGPLAQAPDALSQAIGLTTPKFDYKNPQAIQQAAKQVSSPGQQLDYNQVTQAGYSPTQVKTFLDQNPGVGLTNAPDGWDQQVIQKSILPDQAPITESYGQYQPGVELFSGGVTPGTGFGVKEGTPVAVPGEGRWQVVDAYNGAQDGFIGNGANEGWGNSVVVQNLQNKDFLRLSHLSQVDVGPGDVLGGGYVVGRSGSTGNSSGPHLNIQYLDEKQQPGDFMQSPYAQYVSVK